MTDAVETSVSPDKRKQQLTCCLCIDLIGSTAGGLTLTSRQLDRFNIALVEQIAPHLEQLGLSHVLLKFTGDGWLLLAHGPDRDAIASLCCLAAIMAHKFAEEMVDLSKLSADRIPRLRLALGAGFDLLVTLPNGQTDYVGDSARRAVRALGCRDESCEPAEILVCDVIRQAVMRDFVISDEDVTKIRPKPAKAEELFPLYVLGELRPEAAADFDAPDYHAYTLAVIGKVSEAVQVLEQVSQVVETAAQREPEAAAANVATLVRRWNQVIAGAPDYTTAVDAFGDMRSSGSRPNVVTYSILMHKAKGYREAQGWLARMEAEGIAPDVVTYSTLVAQASDYEAAKSWLARMEQEAITPNVVTYNTLMAKASDYEAAKSWLARMEQEAITPNVVTYNTLVDKAPDYEAAKSWLARMEREGITPDVVTYSTLVAKVPNYEEAQGWLARMEAEGITPDVVTYNTLVAQAPNYEEAQGWLARMEAEGITPNVVTYNTLVAKAPNYEATKSWLQRMEQEGITPDVVTYSKLMHNAPSYEEAKSWLARTEERGVSPNAYAYRTVLEKDLTGIPVSDVLKWYWEQEYHPDGPIEAAIAFYRKKRLMEVVLTLVMHYPYLQAAHKVMRGHPDQSLEWFGGVASDDPTYGTAQYALGECLMVLKRQAEAKVHFETALALADSERRREAIAARLQQFEMERP